jgi:hypothetical protein
MPFASKRKLIDPWIVARLADVVQRAANAPDRPADMEVYAFAARYR